jgi:hypothetical protein
MPTVSYKPQLLEIVDFPHGDTFFSDQIEVTDDATGNPVDMTTYQSAAMRLEERDGTEVVTLTSADGITLGNGFIEFNAETVDWPQNCTIYGDLQLVTAGGNTETWLAVTIKMKPTITPP